MSKHASPKSQDSRRQRAPSAPANSGVSAPGQDGSLSEGDGVVLGLGSGAPDTLPITQRQALIAAATAGNADAQCRMGDLCRTGDEYTPQDFGAALHWYRLSAAQGDANAQNNIGAMYENAMGVPEDNAEAAKWYTLAANQDLAIAQYNLGELLLYGNGIKQDDQAAAAWLHRAAEQGHIEALSELGTMYLFGRGVERRIATAAEMLTVAALDGDHNARGTLGDFYGDIEADAIAGSLLSALSLAKMYDRGLGVERSEAKTFVWLLWGEERGTRDDDADVREELIDMSALYSLTLSDDVKDEAWAMFNDMRAATPRVSATKPQRRRKAPTRRKTAPRAAGSN